MKAWTVLCVLITVAASQAGVDLEWQVVGESFEVGDTVEVELYAVADNAGDDEPFASLSVIMVWDPDVLALQDVNDNGPYAWAFSGFPSDYDGLNDTLDDGDAFYQAWPEFDVIPVATPEGLLITTMQFEALDAADASELVIVPEFGYFAETYVGDEEYAGWNIVDDMGSALVQVNGGGPGLLGDVNCDGAVDFDDINPFVVALGGSAAYRQAYPGCHWLNADINGDGTVSFDDVNPFIALLGG